MSPIELWALRSKASSRLPTLGCECKLLAFFS